MQSSTVFPEVSQKPISEIFQESEPNREKSRKMSKQADELKDGDEEEEYLLSMIQKDWIKIGDEYLQNPVAAIDPSEISINGIATDPSFQCGQSPIRKRKFEEENQEEAEIPKNAFIRKRRRILKEKFVKLDLINPSFKSKSGEVEEDEEGLASTYSFRTKRRYLYHDLKK